MEMCDPSSKKGKWSENKEVAEEEASTDDEGNDMGGTPIEASMDEETDEECSNEQLGLSSSSPELEFDQSLLELARKAKMDSAMKRNIFCTIMSSKVKYTNFFI